MREQNKKFLISEEELIDLSGHQCWDFKKCINGEDCVECDLKDLLQTKTPISVDKNNVDIVVEEIKRILQGWGISYVFNEKEMNKAATSLLNKLDIPKQQSGNEEDIREILLNPKYEVNEFAKNNHGKWDSVQDGKLSLLKELTSIGVSKHSDKNIEAYCENLQRENKYLKEQLSALQLSTGKLDTEADISKYVAELSERQLEYLSKEVAEYFPRPKYNKDEIKKILREFYINCAVMYWEAALDKAASRLSALFGTTKEKHED